MSSIPPPYYLSKRPNGLVAQPSLGGITISQTHFTMGLAAVRWWGNGLYSGSIANVLTLGRDNIVKVL